MLARYHHLKPEALAKAATRWPKLDLEFMTIHASKGQQAEYVIIAGLHEGRDGFPAVARESVLKRCCCRSRRIFRMLKNAACCMSH